MAFRGRIAQHVIETVRTVAALRARAERKVTPHQRVIERLTSWRLTPASRSRTTSPSTPTPLLGSRTFPA